MEHGLASQGVAVVVLMLITVLAVAIFTRYVRVPYTVALVVAGLVIAVSPVDVRVELTPDVILFIFLPALLFESSYNLHFADVRENLRPITLLAVPGVLLTAFFLAASMHYVAGMDWGTAFLFGTIVSATDPVSVLAIFKQLGAPRRLATILEGESLFNDGTALVLFRIVLGVVLTGAMGDTVLTIAQFILVVLGALVLGGLVGYVASFLLSRVNDYLIETAVTLVVAYGTYLLAETIGVSGVIAVVIAALVLGNYGRFASMSATTRIAVASTWDFFGFIANSLIFLLIGLELNVGTFQQYIVPTLLAIAAVLAVRVVVVGGASALLRYIHKPLPFRWQGVLIWGGLRGSLALAMALSLPFVMNNGQPFPDRDLLQVMTFGVILFTLLVQGLTMGPLLKRLGISEVPGWRDEYEMLNARRAMSQAALREIERIGREGVITPDVQERLRDAYQGQLVALDRSLRELQLGKEDVLRENLRSIRRRILQVEKVAVGTLNREGALSEDSMRDLLSEIDAELHDLDEGAAVLLPGDAPEDVRQATGLDEPVHPERVIG
ncbi:MAG TPA: Na+/H+ antiporter [Chloroflexia bacterium]